MNFFMCPFVILLFSSLAAMHKPPSVTFSEHSQKASEVFLKPFFLTYFKKENDILEKEVFNYVSDKLFELTEYNLMRNNKIGEEEVNPQIEYIIHEYITDALENSLKNKESYFNEYKNKHEKRTEHLYIILTASVFVGMFTTLVGIIATYFGAHC